MFFVIPLSQQTAAKHWKHGSPVWACGGTGPLHFPAGRYERLTILGLLYINFIIIIIIIIKQLLTNW